MIDRIVGFCVVQRWLIVVATIGMAAFGAYNFLRLPIDAKLVISMGVYSAPSMLSRRTFAIVPDVPKATVAPVPTSGDALGMTYSLINNRRRLTETDAVFLQHTKQTTLAARR